MSTQLMLPNGVDKLSTPQKVVAIGLLGVAGYFILPFAIALAVNIYIAVALAVPAIFAIYNYRLIWEVFKYISWQATRAFIGLDILGAMDRYYLWVEQQEQILLQSKTDLNKEVIAVSKDIAEREKSHQDNMRRADLADKMNNTVQRDIALDNAQVDKDFIATLAPIKAEGEKQVEYLSEVADVFSVKKQQLEYNIKAQKSKFKSLKAMAKGMGSASAALGGANDARKLWDETNNQLVDKMNQFTANIKTFEDVIKPAIEANKFDKQLRQTEGQKLLEDFRKTNFQLTK